MNIGNMLFDLSNRRECIFLVEKVDELDLIREIGVVWDLILWIFLLFFIFVIN